MPCFLDPGLVSLAPYTPGEQPKGRNFVKLNTNENPYPPSGLVQEAVKEEVAELKLYSDPTCIGVVEPLAEQLGVKPEQVMVGNGSDEILAFLFQGFCPDGAAFADLTYGFYTVFCQLYRVKQQIIPLEEDFTLQPEKYANCGKTIFIANPNAPTGLALTPEEIEEIVLANPDHLVVVDEAYVDFGAQSVVGLVDRYCNLVVVGTFSKSRSLAGARLGFAVGNCQTIQDLNRIRFSFNPYNVNRMTLAAGAAALKDEAYFKECCGKIIKTRTATIQTLRSLGFVVTESMANFVFVTHPQYPGEELYGALREEGILVRWFNLPRIAPYLRITIGTDAEMECLFTALAKIMKKK